MDNRPPREGGSVWQIFTLEQLKSHSWNIRLEPPTHRSVGRLSALYHRLLLQLCKLRHNSPPQDRLHRSKVATLARGKRPIYRTANYQNYSYGCHLSCVPPVNGLQSRLARLASLYQSTPCKPSWVVVKLPRHRQSKTKLQQDHCPIMEKSARRSFQMETLFQPYSVNRH